MTMPDERARSLRWGWEFLWGLQKATNLTPEQLDKVRAIVRHYPSTSEIGDWAREPDPADLTGRWLEPEDPAKATLQPGVPLSFDRGPSTRQEQLQAIAQAIEFLPKLRVSGNLTADQSRSLVYVLRHFPLGT